MAKMFLGGLGTCSHKLLFNFFFFVCYVQGLILVPTRFLYSEKDLRFGFIAHNPSICNDPDRY